MRPSLRSHLAQVPRIRPPTAATLVLRTPPPHPPRRHHWQCSNLLSPHRHPHQQHALNATALSSALSTTPDSTTTIYALSTPPGKSAVAVVRISGPASLDVRLPPIPLPLAKNPGLHHPHNPTRLRDPLLAPKTPLRPPPPPLPPKNPRSPRPRRTMPLLCRTTLTHRRKHPRTTPARGPGNNPRCPRRDPVVCRKYPIC
jgi:hypothetical protein